MKKMSWIDKLIVTEIALTVGNQIIIGISKEIARKYENQ
jgi:hypothetical protein